MNRLLTLLIIGVMFTSCEKSSPLDLDITYPPNPSNPSDSIINYEFEMVGRGYQDPNGYYHLSLDTTPLQQTLHRFGAYITNTDVWGLPTQVIWNCDNYWEYDLFNIPMNVPIINGTSHADPSIDSVFCMMAPVGSMIGDTVEIRGTAIFEEGDVILRDSLQIIFE